MSLSKSKESSATSSRFFMGVIVALHFGKDSRYMCKQLLCETRKSWRATLFQYRLPKGLIKTVASVLSATMTSLFRSPLPTFSGSMTFMTCAQMVTLSYSFVVGKLEMSSFSMLEKSMVMSEQCSSENYLQVGCQFAWFYLAVFQNNRCFCLPELLNLRVVCTIKSYELSNSYTVRRSSYSPAQRVKRWMHGP